MKKKLYFLLLAVAATTMLHAQLDFSSTRIDVGLNYVMYKGDFQNNTPGAKVRVSRLFKENMAALGLGFTYGFPIRVASDVVYTGGGSVPSEIVYDFKTITLDADYFFGGEQEEGFSFNGNIGASIVLVGYKENIKGSIPAGQNLLDQMVPGHDNGLAINLGLGTQYSLGSVKIFGNTGIALPAKKVNGQYIQHAIPRHFTSNVGVRFALGKGKND